MRPSDIGQAFLNVFLQGSNHLSFVTGRINNLDSVNRPRNRGSTCDNFTRNQEIPHMKTDRFLNQAPSISSPPTAPTLRLCIPAALCRSPAISGYANTPVRIINTKPPKIMSMVSVSRHSRHSCISRNAPGDKPPSQMSTYADEWTSPFPVLSRLASVGSCRRAKCASPNTSVVASSPLQCRQII